MRAEDTLDALEPDRRAGQRLARLEVDEHGKVVGAAPWGSPHNWGRWGPLDERGTANFLTPERVREAAALVRTGSVVSCALRIAEPMPVHPSRPRVLHTHLNTGTDLLAGLIEERPWGGWYGTDDHLSFPLQSATHWDGLTHASWGGSFYNGFWVGNVGALGGARRLSTHLLAGSLTGRGVLLDLPRHQGVARLLPGHAITAEQLDACAAAEEVELRSGDLLLLRTGELPWFYSLPDKAPYWSGSHPGLSISTVDWFHRHQIAAAGIDNRTFEVTPFEPPFEVSYPLHTRLIRDLGLTIGELWWLEDLARACAEEARWEFLLSAAPLNVADASGAPACPIAVF